MAAILIHEIETAVPQHAIHSKSEKHFTVVPTGLVNLAAILKVAAILEETFSRGHKGIVSP